MAKPKAGKGKKKGCGKKRKVLMYPGMAGGSPFTDFFTKTIPSAAKWTYGHVLKPVGNFVKDNKLISKGLALIPHPGAKVAAAAAGMAGLGRQRRGRGKQNGGLNALNGRLFLV